MVIVITDEARKYLEGKKAGAITIAAGERPGGSCAKGCVCHAVYPAVKIGRLSRIIDPVT